MRLVIEYEMLFVGGLILLYNKDTIANLSYRKNNGQMGIFLCNNFVIF